MSDYLDSELNLDNYREKFIKYTRKAFQLLPKLKKPRILDIGCGSGLPTIELAKLGDCEITGLDIDQPKLDKLDRKIKELGFYDRVKTVKCSLFEMDFPDESFDIIWAEGSIRIMGFENSLKKWNRLLKANGYLVVHDEIDIISNKLSKLHSWGYELVNFLSLPDSAWWTEFYKPLENRINQLYAKYNGNPEAFAFLKKYRDEIEIVKRSPEEHNTAFYILRKSEKSLMEEF